jgi:hypothetical protein
VDGADEIERCTGERRHTKYYQPGIPTKIGAANFASPSVLHDISSVFRLMFLHYASDWCMVGLKKDGASNAGSKRGTH